VAARALAPPELRRIGIVGTGIQARLQLSWLARVTPCREATVWGRTSAHVASYREAMAAEGFSVSAAPDVSSLAAECDLIVTTTPSATPLLMAADVRPGTHITAVGADSEGKQELEAALLGRADRVVGDSLAQCRERGEIAHALRAGVLSESALVELGELLAGRASGRSSPEAITVCDLTGVAVQDVAIATAVCGAIL
jgi:ornithine cyclodeaminase